MDKDPIKIIDVIHHQNKYGVQIFHVLSRMPIFIYERKGGWLTGEDSGFFNFYRHEAPFGRFKAFAGSKFDISMKDGSVIHADGQWWDDVPPEYSGLLVHVGIGTVEKLNRCNVFSGMMADPEVLKTELAPSNNYDKYRKNHPDFGKHKIESKWEKS